jgi:hypothetical protein
VGPKRRAAAKAGEAKEVKEEVKDMVWVYFEK